MKKEKFYAVNNQEDEDGYTLYPGSAIIYENVKNDNDKRPSVEKENIKPTTAKSHFNNYNHLSSANHKQS